MLDSKKIGNRIAEARKKRTISQAQLAEHLFISPQAVGKWERGESMPDILTLNRLAEILGVDLNYFSEDVDPDVTETMPVEFLETPSAEFPSGNQKKKRSWNMSGGNWVDADFSGLKNLHDKFSSSNMQRCKFIGSDLSGLLLKSNHVDGCDFSGSDLSNSHIQSSYLNNNLFKGCLLNETKISRSHINVCDLSGVKFCETEFTESYIYGCNLTDVDFSGVSIRSGGISGVVVKSDDFGNNKIEKAVWNRTSFIDTQIADLVFTGILDDCYFENCAFTRVTFQNATLTNTFFKNNKKLKRIRFIDCQADRMTYEFLKQGNADLTGIVLLETNASTFVTC